MSPAATSTIAYIVGRKTSPPLNGGQPGSYQLSGPPSSGGLSVDYYDASAFAATAASTLGTQQALFDPTVAPTISRTEPTFYHQNPTSGVPGWMPLDLGAASRAWVRASGSIYLPLDTQDIQFQLPAPVTGRDWAALWVGKTRKGEAVCAVGQAGITQTPGWGETQTSTSPSIRGLLGSTPGWYPIIYEYLWYAGGAYSNWVGFTYNVGGNGSIPVPTVLSPYGIFRQTSGTTPVVSDSDSHYDTIKTTIGETFALQFKTTPQQLESGQFPGTIVPLARVGRDTDFVMNDEQAVNMQETSKAEDNATTDIAQAQGLGGTASGTLWAEAFNFAAMNSHPAILTESDNLPATSEINMLVLQLATLLGLRSTIWQQVTADSIGQRQMQDTFPLTGTLAEFDWQVGDGLRIWLPQIGVTDQQPRQIYTLKRMLYPDGMGVNTASFQGRPRNFEFIMRRFIRSVFTDRRSFQGQLTYLPSSIATGPALSTSSLPVDLSLVVDAQLIVLSKSDSSAWSVMVNGNATTLTGIAAAGSYGIGSYVARNLGTEPRMTVACVPGTTGTGTIVYQLQLLVLV